MQIATSLAGKSAKFPEKRHLLPVVSVMLKFQFENLKQDMMAHQENYVTLLQAAIQQAYNCNSVHHQTVPVLETLYGQTVWKGEVEVFVLNGHAEAKKCYAWVYQKKGQGGRFVTVLEKYPVNSPEMAVKSAIFFDAQTVPFICSE